MEHLGRSFGTSPWSRAFQSVLRSDFHIVGKKWPLKEPPWTQTHGIAKIESDRSDNGGARLPGVVGADFGWSWPKLAAHGAGFNDDQEIRKRSIPQIFLLGSSSPRAQQATPEKYQSLVHATVLVKDMPTKQVRPPKWVAERDLEAVESRVMGSGFPIVSC